VNIQNADLLISCARATDFPAPGPPEVAFLGRSNVGKSSLLNRLVRRKQLARTSSTPGKTRLIHFFRIEVQRRELRMVDLPGYGWAKVSRKERKNWQQLVESYLGDRATLRAAILLQDIRREVTEDETLLLDWLGEREVPCLVALTKIDKLKPMRRAKRIREITAQFDLPKDRIIATSSQTGDGIDLLWKSIFSKGEA
jgi:GTP-binding protein